MFALTPAIPLIQILKTLSTHNKTWIQKVTNFFVGLQFKKALKSSQVDLLPKIQPSDPTLEYFFFRRASWLV